MLQAHRRVYEEPMVHAGERWKQCLLKLNMANL